MADRLGFRQKGTDIPRGFQSEAADADPSEESGFAAKIGVPVWRQFVNNESFQESYKGAIDAEKEYQNRVAQENRSSGGSSAWKGIGGTVSRLNRGIPEEYDAESLIDHPQLGGIARKSIWDRDVKAAKAESEDANFRLKDPSFHARGLAKSDREAIEAEGSMLEEKDPRHVELKAKLVADTEYQAEKSGLAQKSYDAQARARQIEATDPDSWMAQRNQPTAQERRATTVATAQAQRSEADVAEESAARRDTELQGKLAAGMTGPEAVAAQAERAEIAAARGAIAEKRVAAEAPIKQVQAEAAKEKDFFNVGDTVSGIWDAVKGLGTSAPAAFYQLVEGMERPDQYSESAKRAFAEADAFNKEMQAKTAANQAAGTSSSVGESFREAGGSLGFSLGSMAAAIPASMAGMKAGAATGAGIAAMAGIAGPQAAVPEELVTVPVGAALGGTIGAVTAGMAASGTAAYRMAGASFLNESWQQLQAASQEKSGRPMNEEEMASAYSALIPIAQNTALWEAGPEAVGNAVTMGAGKIILGLGTSLAEKFGVGALAKAATKGTLTAAQEAEVAALKGAQKLAFKATIAGETVAGKVAIGAADLGVELGTETVTQVEQGADQKKAQAVAQGQDPSTIKSDWSVGGVVAAFKEVYPQTLALMGLMGGAGGAAKVASMALPSSKKDAAEEKARIDTALQAIDPEASAPTGDEVTRAARFTPSNMGVEGLADGVLIERELAEVEAADAETMAQAQAALNEAQTTGGDVKAAEALVAQARVATGRAALTRAVLKIAAGLPFANLTDAELESVGCKLDGDKVTEMTDEERKAAGVPARMIRGGADKSPILTDAALKLVAATSPRARARVTMDETQALANAAKPKATAAPGAQQFEVTLKSGKKIKVAAATEAEARTAAAGHPDASFMDPVVGAVAIPAAAPAATPVAVPAATPPMDQRQAKSLRTQAASQVLKPGDLLIDRKTGETVVVESVDNNFGKFVVTRNGVREVASNMAHPFEWDGFTQQSPAEVPVATPPAAPPLSPEGLQQRPSADLVQEETRLKDILRLNVTDPAGQENAKIAQEALNNVRAEIARRKADPAFVEPATAPVLADTHTESRSKLDARAKALGYDNARQAVMQNNTGASSNPEVVKLLKDTSDHWSRVVAEKDPAAAAAMPDEDYSAWQKANLKLANEDNLTRIEDLDAAVLGVKAARLRGDKVAEGRLLAKLGEARQKTDHTVESINKNVPKEDHFNQSEVDERNKSAKKFNARLDQVEKELSSTPATPGTAALTRAKARIAELKANSPQLAAAIVDNGARGEMTGGKINVNPDLIIQEALDAGLTEDQANVRFDTVLDEEITHLAQNRSAVTIWKEQGSPGDFNVWFGEHYGITIWQGEFVGKGKAEIVRGLYTGTTAADRKAWDAMDAAGKAASADMPQYSGLAAWDAMPDANKALEGIRVMKQRWSGKSATEAARLWTDISQTLYHELKVLLVELKRLVRKGNLSPALQQEIEYLDAALKQFTPRNPKADPKKPTSGKKGDGTGKPPGSGSGTGGNGGIKPTGSEVAGAALVEGQQVVVTKDGVRYEGVVGKYGGQEVITKNNGFLLVLPDGSKKGFILDAVTIEVVATPEDAVEDQPSPTASESSVTAESIEADYQSAIRLADSWAKTDSVRAGQMRKAAGMQKAAAMRKLTGDLTAKEQQAKDAYEASNYTGKPVSVDGRNGEVTGVNFGKVSVKFEDGTKGSFAPDQINPPVAAAPAVESVAINENRNTDLFPDETDFMGKLDTPVRLSSYTNKNGFGVAEYTNPDNGSTDIYIAAFGDNDFIAYIRVYEDGKPINRFTSKLERRTDANGVTGKMVSELQLRLPENHEYTEDTSVSTDGLRFIQSQLAKGYKIALDESGKPKMQTIAISGESKTNDLPITVDPNGKFENISISTKAEFDKVRPVLAAMLGKFGIGLNESNVQWVSGTVEIDIPVLVKNAVVQTTAAAPKNQSAPEAAPEPFAQQEYKKRKTALNKAIKAGQWQNVIDLATADLAYFEETGYTDDWSNWERAKEDAQQNIQRTPLVEPITKPLAPAAPEAEAMPPAPAPPKPTLTPGEQALKDAFSDMVDGLDSAPLVPDDFYRSKGIPREKRNTFMNVADTLYDEGVRTPEALAMALEKAGNGKLRPYSAAMWSILQANYPELSNFSEWSGAYSEIDKTSANGELKPQNQTNEQTERDGNGGNPIDNGQEGTPEESPAENPDPNVDSSAGGNPESGGLPSGQPDGSGRSELPGGSVPTGNGDAQGGGDNNGTTPGNSGSGSPVAGAGVRDGTRPDVGSPEANFVIEDSFSMPKGEKARIAANMQAINLLRKIESEGRNATAAEKQTLAKYSGWGSFKNAFNKVNQRKWTEINERIKNTSLYYKDNIRNSEAYQELSAWREKWGELHDQLAEMLSDEEFRAMSKSIRNAHYTALPVIDAMWNMVRAMGFKGGKVLETSAGAGYFVGRQPGDLASASQWSAVELDSITARIFSKLYPESRINGNAPDPGRNVDGQGFQKSKIPNNSMDLVIGNFPFAKDGPMESVREFGKKLNLHNYFFARSIDKLKPGGIVIAITSNSTMDNNLIQRELIAGRVELVSAIRLPNNAFKESAGTEVTTDIIILRKKDGSRDSLSESWINVESVGDDTVYAKKGDKDDHEFLSSIPAEWVPVDAELREEWKEWRARRPKSGQKWDALFDAIRERGYTPARGIPFTAPMVVNEYFARHPEMVIGRHALEGSMYSAGSYAVVSDGSDVQARLNEIVGMLPSNLFGEVADINTSEAEILEAGDQHREGSIILENDQPYHVVKGQLVPVRWDLEYTEDFLPDDKAVKAILASDPALKADFDKNLNGLSGKPLADWLNDFLEEHLPAAAAQKIRDKIKKETDRRNKVFKSWVMVRNAGRSLMDAELRGDMAADLYRDVLNQAYDAHVKEHGAFSARNRPGKPNPHRFLFDEDDSPLLESLEDEILTGTDEKGKPIYRYEKRPIFTESMQSSAVAPTEAQDIKDAVGISMGYKGRISVPYMAELLKVSNDEAEKQLMDSGLAFKNPKSGLYETSDTYLSGEVRAKLREAMDADMLEPGRFATNIEALKAVEPKNRPIQSISIILGARWLPGSIYQKFGEEFLEMDSPVIRYEPAVNMWQIKTEGERRRRGQANPSAANPDYLGTNLMTAEEIFESLLNSREIRIMKPGPTRGSVVLDAESTIEAQTKASQMMDKFAEWVKTTKDDVEHEGETMRVGSLAEREFNDKVAGLVTPTFTGDWVTLPGQSGEIWLKPHRKAVLARLLTMGYGMMAHGVGSGKTYNQIALAMELRRLGKARRPVTIVQNSTIRQFAASHMKAYPHAKILVADESNFSSRKRARFLSKIATGDYDSVIMTHSNISQIGHDEQAIRNYMARAIGQLEEILASTESGSQEQGDIQAALDMLQEKLDKMLQKAMSRAGSILTWEQLGVDALIVDEAHEFKNAPIITRKQRIKNLPSGEASDRAVMMQIKASSVQATTGGKNVFFATGTPITNTMAEAYTMLNFIAPTLMESKGINNFDDFATMFGRTVTEPESTWRGEIELVERFAKFVNGPELVALIRSVFDVSLGNEAMGLRVPKMKGGGPEMLIIEPTEASEIFNDWVIDTAAEFDAIENKRQAFEESPWMQAIPIMVMQAGMAQAIDPRLINPNAPDDPSSKVNQMVGKIWDIYQAGTERKTAQVVFTDLSNPFSTLLLKEFNGDPFEEYGTATPEMQALEAQIMDAPTETDAEKSAKKRLVTRYNKLVEARFNLMDDIKDKLVAKGIPASEILLAKSNLDKKKLQASFDKVNSGEIRIIVGSTARLGVGVNIQERLAAAHNLSPPRDFKPAMMEQRIGRILRQGNLHRDWSDQAFIDVVEKLSKQKFDAKKLEKRYEQAVEWLDKSGTGKMKEVALKAEAEFEIIVINYGLKYSMDSSVYSMMKAKQRFIDQVLMGENVLDEFDDPMSEESASFALMAAESMGDENLKRRVILDGELNKLTALRVVYFRDIHNRENSLDDAKSQSEHYRKMDAEGIREEGKKFAGLYGRKTRTVKTTKEVMAKLQGNEWSGKELTPEQAKEPVERQVEAPVYQFGDKEIDTAKPDGKITAPMNEFIADAMVDAKDTDTIVTRDVTVNGERFVFAVQYRKRWDKSDSYSARIVWPGKVAGKVVFEAYVNVDGESPAQSLLEGIRSLSAPDYSERYASNVEAQIKQYEQTIKTLQPMVDNPRVFEQETEWRDKSREMIEVNRRLAQANSDPRKHRFYRSLSKMVGVDAAEQILGIDGKTGMPNLSPDVWTRMHIRFRLARRGIESTPQAITERLRSVVQSDTSTAQAEAASEESDVINRGFEPESIESQRVGTVETFGGKLFESKSEKGPQYLRLTRQLAGLKKTLERYDEKYPDGNSEGNVKLGLDQEAAQEARENLERLKGETSEEFSDRFDAVNKREDDLNATDSFRVKLEMKIEALEKELTELESVRATADSSTPYGYTKSAFGTLYSAPLKPNPVHQVIRDAISKVDAGGAKQTIETSPLEGGRVRSIAKKLNTLVGSRSRLDWSRNSKGTKKKFPEGQEAKWIKDTEIAGQRVLESLRIAGDLFPKFQSWYESRLKMAMEIFAELDNDAAKPEHQFILRAALAITSNGNKVKDQTIDTWKVYQDWKTTGKLGGTKVGGTRSGEIRKALKQLDITIAMIGWEKTDSFLQTVGTVGELRKTLENDFGFTRKEASKATSGELVDEVVPFALIFGPKLGSFFHNLSGNFATTTMDRWFMRTFSRAIGQQIQKVEASDVAEKTERVNSALIRLRETKGGRDFLYSIGVHGQSKSSIKNVRILAKYFEKEANRENLTASQNELRLAANGLFKVADGYQLVEAPQNGSHRRFIRLAMDYARSKFSEETGKDWSAAELQALLWYFEKVVHDTFGSPQTDENPDYASAANFVFKSAKGKDARGYRSSDAVTRGGSKKLGNGVVGEADGGSDLNAAPLKALRSAPLRADSPEWKAMSTEERKDHIVSIKGRPFSPIVRDLLNRREKGENISRETLDRAVKEYFPSRKIKVPKSMSELPSQREVLAAVNKAQRNEHAETMDKGLPEHGSSLTVRQDVPAMTRHGVGVVTTVTTNGTLYRVSTRFSSPVFKTNEKQTLKIGMGGDKGPHIVIKGKWMADQSMPTDLESWTQVGFNPDRHSYYYERGTERLVNGGTEAFQVGNTVFIKEPKFGNSDDALYSAPLPKANSFPRGVPQAFTEEARDHQQASGKNLTYERAGFGSEANREQLDVVTAYYDTINEIQTNADNLAEARRMLANNPGDIDAKLKSAATDKMFQLTPADNVAMQLRINQLTEQAGDNQQLQAENGARMLAYRIMRGDVARVLQIGWDRDLKPAERALAALTEAIYMPSKKIQKTIASMPLSERKAAITKAAEARIAAVSAELAKINLKLSDITKENEKLKLANSKLMKDVQKARPKIQQNVLKMVQQGASLEDIKRRLNVSAEEAQKINRDAREELRAKIAPMVAAGMSMEEIVKKLNSLQSAPLGAGKQLTPEQIAAEVERVLTIGFGLPEEIRAKNLKPKKVTKTQPVNVMEANWARPVFTDNLNDWAFDTKDRANIMQRVEIIRGLAGAIGKISSLESNKQVQAMAALAEINTILAKYGTDTKDIFESSQAVEAYGFDINDINHVGAVARMISTMDADFVDKASELIYANMLSGLQTMIVNATAIIPATWEVTVGRAYELAVNSMVKDSMSAQLGESQYILKAIKPAWLRAMSNFKASFISQHPMFDRDVLAHEIDWDKILGGGGYRINGSISGKKGDIIRIPMRLLAATDDFNRTLMACVEVGTFAFRIAKRMSEDPKSDLYGTKPGDPKFDAFLKSEVNTPGSPSYLLAAQKASRAIFSNPLPGQQDPTTGKNIQVNDLGDVVGYAAASLNKFAAQEHDNIFAKAALAIVRVSFFPFQRTPFNILRKGVRHTLNPFSIFDILLGTYQNSRKDNLDGTKSWKWNANGRNAELVERVGQQLQGATLMLILAAMTAGEGDDDDQDKPFMITGSSPFTPRGRAERETQARSGIGPYRISFRKDGKERFGVSYGRFEPIATTLAATIDLMKSVKRSWRSGGGNSEAAAAALGGFAAQAQDKSFMKGISDLIALGTNILAEPDLKDNRKFQQFLASRFSMVFPNIIKQPIREIDENFRERSDSFMQELLYQVIPAGQKPAKMDPYGDKVTKTGNAAGRIIDMTEMGTDTVNPVDSMLLRFRDKHPDAAWFPTSITTADFKNPKTGLNQKMTGEQLVTFREMAGKRTKALLKSQNINYANPTEADVKKVKSAYEQAKSEIKKGLAFRFSK